MAPGFVTCSPFTKSDACGRVASGTADSLLCLLPSQNFYNQVSTPLLKKIQFNYPQESVSDVTQSSFHNYFGGSEIVVAGKVDTENLQHLESIVTATAVSEGVPRIPAPGAWAGSFTHVQSPCWRLLPVECFVHLGPGWEHAETEGEFVQQRFTIASSMPMSSH